MHYYAILPAKIFWAGINTVETPLYIKTETAIAEGNIYRLDIKTQEGNYAAFSILKHPKHGELVAVSADGQTAGITDIQPTEHDSHRILATIYSQMPVKYVAIALNLHYNGFGRSDREKATIDELHFEVQKLTEETKANLTLTGTVKIDGLTYNINTIALCRIIKDGHNDFTLVLPNNLMYFIETEEFWEKAKNSYGRKMNLKEYIGGEQNKEEYRKALGMDPNPSVSPTATHQANREKQTMDTHPNAMAIKPGSTKDQIFLDGDFNPESYEARVRQATGNRNRENDAVSRENTISNYCSDHPACEQGINKRKCSRCPF